MKRKKKSYWPEDFKTETINQSTPNSMSSGNILQEWWQRQHNFKNGKRETSSADQYYKKW